MHGCDGTGWRDEVRSWQALPAKGLKGPKGRLDAQIFVLKAVTQRKSGHRYGPIGVLSQCQNGGASLLRKRIDLLHFRVASWARGCPQVKIKGFAL